MRNECTTKTWNAKSNYFKVSLSQNFYNPRQFWNRLNLVLNRHKKNILNQIQINNEFISDPLDISHAFNRHFSSICNSYQFDSNWTACPSYNSFSDHSFSFKKILPNDVFFSLCQLKDNTSAGTDGLEVKFVKLAPCLDVSPC